MLYRNSLMSFITYENRRNPHVTIHREGCKQIAKNGGTHKYGQGAYHVHLTLPEADAHAQTTGLPVRHCSFCVPQSNADPDMLPEYDFSKGIRGKYAGRKNDGNHMARPALDADSWRAVLEKEFTGDEGTVWWRMRLGGWDEAAYQKLVAAMRKCCEVHESKETVERWIADGFYSLARLGVQDDPKVATYPIDAAAEFDALAIWLFSPPTGTTPKTK